MQTTKLQVAWTKLNSFLVANTTLVDSGHILPAQELLTELTSAKEEFTTELSKLLEELEPAETSRMVEEAVRSNPSLKKAVKEESNICASKPELRNEEVTEEEEEEEEEEDDADCSDCDETIDGVQQ